MRSAGRTTGERTADSCSRKAMNALESGPFCSLVRSGFFEGGNGLWRKVFPTTTNFKKKFKKAKEEFHHD